MGQIALILLSSVSLLVAPPANAASLDHNAVAALESVAGPRITVNCTLQRPEALGHAFVARRAIGVRPWVCRRLNQLLLDAPEPYTSDSYLAAWAVLILTHEAVHLSDYTGAGDEALTECRAVQLVREVALAAGLGEGIAGALGHEALRYDAMLPGYGDYRVGLGLIANYHATGCYDGGQLDIHPDSTDWPN
jgi:hypothetical protein